MMDELRARFLPRFLAHGRERLARVAELLAAGAPLAEVAAELHALAGEAAMLGLGEVAASARTGEEAARRADAAACRDSVAALGPQLERLV